MTPFPPALLSLMSIVGGLSGALLLKRVLFWAGIRVADRLVARAEGRELQNHHLTPAGRANHACMRKQG